MIKFNPSKLDLSGQRFGRLVAIKEVPTADKRNTRWYCLCDCGNATITTTHNLRSGDTKSCGCLHRDTLTKDISGLKFGRLKVLHRDGVDFRGRSLWKCKCDCGNEIALPVNALTSGNTKSCGCLARDVQRKRMLDYNTKYFDEDSYILSRRLLGMKSRCYNKHNRAYVNYGGRGITVCDEWNKDTFAFIKWAKSHGFKKELSIDRIDNNGPYSPENCRWVNANVQSNNRRNNRLFTIRNVTKSVAQWINHLGLPESYHKGLYSEPDHVIRPILIDRVGYIIRSLHLENEKDLNKIIDEYNRDRSRVK